MSITITTTMQSQSSQRKATIRSVFFTLFVVSTISLVLVANNSITTTTSSTTTTIRKQHGILTIKQQQQQQQKPFRVRRLEARDDEKEEEEEDDDDDNNDRVQGGGSVISSSIDNGGTRGVVVDYLTSLLNHHHLDSFIMFLWDKDGNLINHSPISHHQVWIPDTILSSAYSKTNPSPHGKVAMLFNNDVLMKLEAKEVPDPPIPILLYSKPHSKESISNFQLIPTAYEVIGSNEQFIDSIKHYLGNKFILSYETYQQRESIIVWRGAIHGAVEQSRRDAIALNDSEASKIAASSSYKQWIDVTISSRLGSKFTPEYMISTYKYQLDIGGVSGTSWGGLRWKMCGGGLIFKVNTWANDLWHNSIEEWKHYVPVNADLSNLYEMYEWAENNPTKAYTIAKAGQEQCLQSYKTETAIQVLSDMINTIPDSTEDFMLQAQFFYDHYLYSFISEEEMFGKHATNNNK